MSAQGAHASKKKWDIRRIISTIAAVVLVCALAAMAVIGFSYWQGQNEYAKLREKAGLNIKDAGSLGAMSVDWDALRAENSDVVGWISMPDTPMDYPIAQASDNYYYLNHSFSGEQNWLATFGTIFLECENNSEFNDDVNFLYGHHMNDGSMFAFVDTMTKQDVFDKNDTFYILTPKGNFRMRTFAMLVTEATDPVVQPNFGDKAHKWAYIKDKIDRSVVEAPWVETLDMSSAKIFGMSTCDYSLGDGRAVLFSYVAESTVPGVVGLEEMSLNERGMGQLAAGQLLQG